MIDNPCQKGMMKDYRKKLVLRLDILEELDKIKVVQAERLSYKGLINVNVETLISKYKNERQMLDAKDRMETELYLEYMTEMGISSADRMMKSLDEFAKMDEFTQLHNQFEGMMKGIKEKVDEQETKDETLKA